MRATVETGSTFVTLSPRDADGRAQRGETDRRCDDLPAVWREINQVSQSVLGLRIARAALADM